MTTPLRVALFGLGAVGRKIPGLLGDGIELTIVTQHPERRSLPGLSPRHVADATWVQAGSVPDCDIGIIALPVGEHRAIAQRLVQRDADVVSLSDSVDDVQALQRLDADALQRGRRIVAGAGFSPGLSCVLARHAAAHFETIEEVHVAKAGTGGPSCARQHHAALKRSAWDYRDGTWRHRPGGSGRELLWFPDPVGGADCYRAELADALLLHPAFPNAQRISARVAATRRDRFTSRLPMLTPPHAEGGVGAVRVEVWGTSTDQLHARVFGVAAHPCIWRRGQRHSHHVRARKTAKTSDGMGWDTRTGPVGGCRLVPAPGRKTRPNDRDLRGPPRVGGLTSRSIDASHVGGASDSGDQNRRAKP